ncbi:MAG: 50S ribosomal protein L18 [Candidatus Acidiferrales bacterium]
MRFGRARKPVAKLTRAEHRRTIHRRVRTRVTGDEGRPRLSVFRSLKHIYAQVVDDATGRTLVAASSLEKQVRQQASYGGNIAAAKVVGLVLGERAKKAGVTRVVFDRGGYQYHGRVKALADAAREAGLNF